MNAYLLIMNYLMKTTSFYFKATYAIHSLQLAFSHRNYSLFLALQMDNQTLRFSLKQKSLSSVAEV